MNQLELKLLERAKTLYPNIFKTKESENAFVLGLRVSFVKKDTEISLLKKDLENAKKQTMNQKSANQQKLENAIVDFLSKKLKNLLE